MSNQSKTKPPADSAAITTPKPSADSAALRADVAQRLADATGRGAIWLADKMAADEIDPAIVARMLVDGDIDSATALVLGTAKAT